MNWDDHTAGIDFALLNRFADGELDPADAERVRTHLEFCARCREIVSFIEGLGPAIRSLPTSKPPDESLDDLLGGASKPPEVIPFPPEVETTGASARSWSLPSFAAAALVVIALVVTLFVSPDRVMAGSNILTLRPTNAGMKLEYQTISTLAAEASLRARIRYWVPDSLRVTQTEPGYAEVELTREDAGRFEGVANLPPGTVYAIASVEDQAGDRIDTNYGAFWEYLERDETGRPTLQARLYGLLAAEMFATARVAAVARTAASEFPDRPEFWTTLLLFGRDGVTAFQGDSLLRTHAARYDVLDADTQARDAEPEEMYALSLYARLLTRPDREGYWRERLTSEFPRHEYAAQARRASIMISTMSSGERLEALERDWEVAPMPATAQLALSLSYEFADPALTGKWLERHASASVLRDFDHDVETARQLAGVPGLQGLAETWINDRLDGASDWHGRERDLDESRRSFEASLRAGRARLNLALARLRLADGELSEARAAVERAVERDWDPETFFEAARIHAALGASDRAARLLAFARVDPVAPIMSSLRAPGARSVLEPTQFQLEQAHSAFRDRVRGTLLRETIDGHASLMSSSGERTTLLQVANERLTLIVYVLQPRFLPTEAHDLLDANADGLASTGAATLLVSQEPTSSGSEHVAFEDTEHRVMAALGGFRTPQYFVLDAAGDLRYRGDDVAAALRVAFVLQGDSPPNEDAQTTEGELP